MIGVEPGSLFPSADKTGSVSDGPLEPGRQAKVDEVLLHWGNMAHKETRCAELKRRDPEGNI